MLWKITQTLEAEERKNKQMKIKTIPIPIYGGSLILIKDKNFKKTSKKYKLKLSAKYGAYSFENKKAKEFEYVISFVDDNPSLVAHESSHICNFIFKNIGAKLNTKNDEPQCYLIGWIVDEIEIFLNSTKL